jgi:hypothetical protein
MAELIRKDVEQHVAAHLPADLLALRVRMSSIAPDGNSQNYDGSARQVARDLEPASVFISRKTQRLYVQRAFEPILESPVTILDADRPIGTHVFTAIEPANSDSSSVARRVTDKRRPSGAGP